MTQNTSGLVKVLSRVCLQQETRDLLPASDSLALWSCHRAQRISERQPIARVQSQRAHGVHTKVNPSTRLRCAYCVRTTHQPQRPLAQRRTETGASAYVRSTTTPQLFSIQTLHTLCTNSNVAVEMSRWHSQTPGHELRLGQSSTRFASGRLPIPAKGMGGKRCVSLYMRIWAFLCVHEFSIFSTHKAMALYPNTHDTGTCPIST